MTPTCCDICIHVMYRCSFRGCAAVIIRYWSRVWKPNAGRQHKEVWARLQGKQMITGAIMRSQLKHQ